MWVVSPFWPINPHVFQPRLDAERVQEPVIVVRRAVALVHGDVELVRPLDQIERVDLERDDGFAGK